MPSAAEAAPRPSLSVIIPSHNGLSTLPDAIASLLAQTRDVDEIIVVDDGSGDGSPELVSQTFPGVRLVRLTSNHGVGYARNLGAAVATSEFIAFLDQDDVWLPSRCERMMQIATGRPTWDAWVTGIQVFATHGQQLDDHPFGGWVEHWIDPDEVLVRAAALDPGPFTDAGEAIPVERLLNWTVSVTTSYVLRRVTYQAVGGCAPWIRSADDWVMLQNLARHTTVHEVPDRSMLYRVHGQNTSLRTEWDLPLLLASAAVRHGGTVVPGGSARDARVVGRLSDSGFLMNLLRDLARSDRAGAGRDAVAAVALLATDGRDRRDVLVRLGRARAKAWVSRVQVRPSASEKGQP